MSKHARFLALLVWGIILALLIIPLPNQVVLADDGSNSCQFQPMATDRTPTLDNILKVARGGSNLTWDNTYIGLHRWTYSQWPGVDYVVETTVAFKSGGRVSWVGWDGAGGGHSIMIDGTGPCKGWRLFYGHLNYDATTKFKVGDTVGPDDVIGKPGCSGFESYCTTNGGSIPPHNHVILGYWQNIFHFDDGTQIAQVKGYWFIHPTRVEGNSTAVKQFENNSQKPKVNIPDTNTEPTEFTTDMPMPDVSPYIPISFLDQLVITFAPFRSLIIICLGILAILWLGGIIYSREFRRGMIPLTIVVSLVVFGFVGIGRVTANSQVFSAPRNSDFVVDVGSSADWAVDLNPSKPKPAQESVSQNDTPSAPSSDGCSLPTSYPQNVLRWCSWIEQYAKAKNIDPRMIAAVMLQESGGDPVVLSGSGAVGLLQVMPRDGISATFHNANGVPYFSNRPSIAELKDPEFNIKYGTNMLAGLGINDNPREALLHYGPNPDDLQRIYGSRYYYADLVLSIYHRYR